MHQAPGHAHPQKTNSCIPALPSQMEAEAEADSGERGKAVTSRNQVRPGLILHGLQSSRTRIVYLEAGSQQPWEAREIITQGHSALGKTLRAKCASTQSFSDFRKAISACISPCASEGPTLWSVSFTIFEVPLQCLRLAEAGVLAARCPSSKLGPAWAPDPISPLPGGLELREGKGLAPDAQPAPGLESRPSGSETYLDREA